MCQCARLAFAVPSAGTRPSCHSERSRSAPLSVIPSGAEESLGQSLVLHQSFLRDASATPPAPLSMTHTSVCVIDTPRRGSIESPSCKRRRRAPNRWRATCGVVSPLSHPFPRVPSPAAAPTAAPSPTGRGDQAVRCRARLVVIPSGAQRSFVCHSERSRGISQGSAPSASNVSREMLRLRSA